MKTRWIPIILIVLLFTALSPVLAQNATATVNTGNLNVRSGPGVSYSILTTIARGTIVTLLGRNNAATWAQVLTPTGINGWVNASYLLPTVNIATLPITDGTATITGTVTGAFHLNVRSGAGAGFAILAVLDRGAGVTVIGRNAASTWVQVRTSAGVTGWVNAGFLTFSAAISGLPIADGSAANPPPATGGPVTGPRIHIVQPGENLYRISLLYNVSMWSIAQANGILNLNRIYAGQRLVIP